MSLWCLLFDPQLITHHQQWTQLGGSNYLFVMHVTDQQTCTLKNRNQIMGVLIFIPIFVDASLQICQCKHKFCCVNPIKASWRTWKMSQNCTHILWSKCAMPPMIATQWLQDNFYWMMVNSVGCTEPSVYWNLYTLKP